MISYHYLKPKASTNLAHYWLGWSNFTVFNLDNMAGTIGRNVWSPIQWKLHQRQEDNFSLSQVIGLDFDDGKFTIDDALHYVDKHELAYILGVTKSHNIHKGDQPPCDRFRLVLFWEKPIKNLDTYHYNISLMLKKFPFADQNCKDAARMYMPCKRIISYRDGKKFDVKQRPASFLTKEQLIEKHHKNLEAHKTKSLIPKSVIRKISGHIAHGERNKTTYGVACDLHKLGWTEDKIYDYVIQNPQIESLGQKEIMITIKSAINK